MAADLKTLSDHIKGHLGDAVTGATLALGELTIHAEAGRIIDVLRFLHDDPECCFVCFTDLTAADYPEREKRFDVIYQLLSPTKNARIRVKIEVGEGDDVATALAVYKAADWFEREVFDMYGIIFTGHPDLRRILTDYGFQGHPLRKDFPTTGYVEVRYDDEQKRVVYEPVKLVQEFRQFDYLSPWEGGKYVLPGDEKAKR
jgi:NADH-quinone oxidoreductase subunit C